MKIPSKISAALPFRQKLFRSRQTFAHHFQVVIAVAKFDEHSSQSNQVLNLIAQTPSMLAAQRIKFSPLFVGHADIESEIFLCHSFNIAKAAP